MSAHACTPFVRAHTQGMHTHNSLSAVLSALFKFCPISLWFPVSLASRNRPSLLVPSLLRYTVETLVSGDIQTELPTGSVPYPLLCSEKVVAQLASFFLRAFA
jgi:hypothetical protein